MSRGMICALVCTCSEPDIGSYSCLCIQSPNKVLLCSGNRAGKRKRVIQTYDEGELRRSLRDKPAKIGEPVLPARPGRKRKADQTGPDMKKRKPGRPPGRGPGRPPVLHSPGISSKGPLPSGWSVSLKDSKKEIGKKLKQYKVISKDLFLVRLACKQHFVNVCIIARVHLIACQCAAPSRGLQPLSLWVCQPV